VNLQNIVKMRLSTRLVALTLKIFLKRTAAFIAKSYGPLNFFLDLAGCALEALSDRVIEMLFYHIRALLPTQLLIPLVWFEAVGASLPTSLGEVESRCDPYVVV